MNTTYMYLHSPRVLLDVSPACAVPQPYSTRSGSTSLYTALYVDGRRHVPTSTLVGTSSTVLMDVFV